MASLKQIHSAVVLVADRPSGCVGEGDALITDRSGVSLSIRTADCFPILLADTRRRAVAAIHAGWRGISAQICAETVKNMHIRFGSSPGDIYAAIGPGIGVCCYEVGLDVARRFGMDRAGRLDLAAAIRRQLVESGVSESRVEAIPGCTRCDAERFHSFRRDQQNSGRMISYIRIARPETPRAR